MFKELGAMMSLMGNKGKIQDAIADFQKKVPTLAAEATAGAGYVTAKVNGKFEVLSVRISDEAMALNDREMLEDLVTGAVNQAMAKARQLVADESAKMATAIGLPPGLLGSGLPGMG